MKTAITGATGQLGRLVVSHLKQKGKTDEVIALVRDVEKGKELGVETRVFDYASSLEVLSSALNGVEQLLLISGNEIGQRVIQHKNVIEAAKLAGVKHIVYTSLLHADQSSLMLAPEHLATEEAVKASGLEYTILRNGWYTENYTASVPSALQHGAFVGSAEDGQIASAARNDYAEAAAVVLTSEGHAGKVYELAGDTHYTLSDLAETLSEVTGKNIPYVNLPEAEYAGVLTKAGFPEMMAGAFASFDTSASKGDLFDDNKQLSQLIGRSTTPLKTVIESAL